MNTLQRTLATLALFAVAFSFTTRASAALPAKGTEILWDRYGIPHIFASDHASLFYAYGYAQMEAHSELLVRLYTQARGRAAELYGEQYLDSDRWVRVNGIPERAKQWATRQSPNRHQRLGIDAERRFSCAVVVLYDSAVTHSYRSAVIGSTRVARRAGK
jgi:acyl-homoserine lactone acylase PvdQ